MANHNPEKEVMKPREPRDEQARKEMELSNQALVSEAYSDKGASDRFRQTDKVSEGVKEVSEMTEQQRVMQVIASIDRARELQRGLPAEMQQSVFENNRVLGPVAKLIDPSDPESWNSFKGMLQKAYKLEG